MNISFNRQSTDDKPRKESPNSYVNVVGIKKKKIECRVWSTSQTKDDSAKDLQINTKVTPKLVFTKKVTLGVTEFKCRVSKTQVNKYRIDYNELKEGRHSYIYDCDLMNAVGALSFFRYDLEQVPANQNETLLQEGAVKGFIDKGGLPQWLFIVLAFTALIAIGGLVFILPDYIANGAKVDTLTKAFQASQAQVTALKAQVAGLSGH